MAISDKLAKKSNVSTLAAAVDKDRLWKRHLDMSRIGATGRGGVNRQALTRADGEARKLLVTWARERGFTTSVDPIGNLFLRRPGSDARAAPVATGSHLDTQPSGGNFDGVFGVLAGLELLEAMEDTRFATYRSVEVVVWTNEEGARFQPTTMGSAVHASALPLDVALATTDRDGITVAKALEAIQPDMAGAEPRPLGLPFHAYVEAHIEQGPVLEAGDLSVGVVTGIQGLRLFGVEILGEEAHAGTAPMGRRRDALKAAVRAIHALEREIVDKEGLMRWTVGRFDAAPGSPNTVPARVYFTIDLRHPDSAALDSGSRIIAATLQETAGLCTVDIKKLLDSQPTAFDTDIINKIREAAAALGLRHCDILSGATHDAKFIAELCPTAMIFVPCKDGISHNEAESSRPEDLFAGTQTLAAVIADLAQR